MAIARLGRQAKRSYGLCLKLTAVTVLGLCFILIWSLFSSSSSSVTTQRGTFGDINEAIAADGKISRSQIHHQHKKEPKKENRKGKIESRDGDNGSADKVFDDLRKRGNERDVGKDGEVELEVDKKDDLTAGSEDKEEIEQKEEVEENDKEEASVNEEEKDGEVDGEVRDKIEDDNGGSVNIGKKMKKNNNIGPLFDQKAHYSWKLCNTKSKHNYIPCIDFESSSGKLKSYRHHERSCPKTQPMCLVPLPSEGYELPVSWPESKLKIWYKNVAHPKLNAFVKTQNWVVESGDYLTFPQNQSEIQGGILHYLESIEEMVPDIEWGKNIRIVLDIGCLDTSFASTLLDKDVFTLSLGLKDDLVDLAQISLERGFAAIVGFLGNRRLPFPSGVFDAIHCSECNVNWHANGGKLLLEMNRIMRPGGYFIVSTKHDTIEIEEAMTKLTASICWSILAHKTDEVGDIGVKIYHKPESNDIYGVRRKKIPPLCTENENPDATWYVPIKSCLDTVPSSMEQHGAEWPEEWPKRLQTFPDWMNDREKLASDTEHWKSIVNNSYLAGIGVDWSKIRNIMDMKAINGGFAAALAEQKVWVMNVVPVHAPDTLPIIYERGLVGVYHDWCESFGTYPRSYDLLHADHLFSRLKNRCKQPVAIVVEMDRLLRPGGWAIIRDKVLILDPLESIFKSLQWDIRMAYHQDKEGILCVQKSMWRP